MSGPHGRRGLALLLALAAALAVGTTTHAADRPHAKRLTVLGLGQGSAPVRSRVLTRAGTRRLAAQPGAWGGSYAVRSGAHVTIYSSRYYAVDNAVNQSAADFVDSLVHGSEIGTVKIYFAPPDEVKILCYSPDVDGCYFSSTQEIITLGEDTAWSTVEEVLAHEYGHHVANNRNNHPWPAIAYGTKRWATYKGICAKEVAGQAFPGDEGEHYLQNPGEAFAESFLHLNEVKLGMPETQWFYDPALAPDAGALAAIQQDVTKPWKDDVIKRWRGRFARRGQQKSYTFETPLDGVFAAQVVGPRGSSLRVNGAADIKRMSPSLSAALICGQRTVSTRFSAGAKGPFAGAVAIP
jgi:hypothetical protein